MKTNKFFLMAAAAMMSVSMAFTSCSDSNAQDTPDAAATKVETLTEALTSWDGATLPAYPQGDSTKLTILKYVIPAHSSLARHYHPIMSFGYVMQGDLTVVAEGGGEKTFHAGDAVVETVNTWHHGENRGDTDVILIISYAGTTKTPLVIKEDE